MAGHSDTSNALSEAFAEPQAESKGNTNHWIDNGVASVSFAWRGASGCRDFSVWATRVRSQET